MVSVDENKGIQQLPKKRFTMERPFYFTLSFLFLSLFSYSQISLDVEGDSKIQGKLELQASPTNYTSVIIGLRAGEMDMTGFQNVFLGWEAGRFNVNSGNNTAIGSQALLSNSGGWNTAVGSGSMFYSLGVKNTAIGTEALVFNANGENNVSIGYQSGLNSTGSNRDG
jgi:hypothetical protein